ncbi:MAG: 16S rRNA (uracil(1498)-N(3))-methyltransferase [Gammaproteobacteria bacterium]|nr:16S rRNA (uracil(1498)-N(3))-methyltransferase [Gammaproteobacteria bacterium]
MTIRQHRIFHEGTLEIGTEVALSVDSGHYLRQVMRARSGQLITLFNGAGGEYRATILTIEKRECRVLVDQFIDREVESSLDITLLQGISKGDKMDFTIQKAVELGVNHVVPLLTERSVIKLDTKRGQKKREHWQGVAIAAAAQSGRNRITTIAPIIKLSECLLTTNKSNANKLMLSPSAKLGFNSIAQSQSITLLIGPEGGLSDGEERAAAAAGFCAVRFGPRVLRTETAAIAAVGLIQGVWGDLGC